MMDTMERLMEDPMAAYGGIGSQLAADTTTSYSRGRTPWEIKEGEDDYRQRNGRACRHEETSQRDQERHRYELEK